MPARRVLNQPDRAWKFILVLAGLAGISGHFLVVFQVLFGFYHVNLLLCIINQIIQQNSLINTMYKREKATAVTRGMYSSSKHGTVNENMAQRERKGVYTECIC